MEGVGQPTERMARAILLAAAAATLILAALRVFGADEATFVSRISVDDTYYYLQIARNLADGLGPTFDGEDWTNGFQPVWAALLVPLFWVLEDGPLAARWACFLAALFHVGALLLLERALRPRLGALPAALACAAGLLAWPLREVGMQGMDWSLNAFLAAAGVLSARWLAREPGVAARLGIGALLGCLVIQRPDAAALAGLVLLPHLGRRNWRLLGPVIAGGAAVALPYLLGSLLAFGSPLPVSGKIKTDNALDRLTTERAVAAVERVVERSLPDPPATLLGGGATGAADLAAARPWWAAGLLVVAGLVGLRRATRAARDADGRPDAPVLLPLLGYAAVHVPVVAVLLHPYVLYGRWYQAPEDLAAVALLGGALSLVVGPGRAPRWRAAGGAVGALLLAAATVHAEHRLRSAPEVPALQRQRVALEVANWIVTELPPDSRIGIFNAGRFGYYTDGRVVNLDGLVNTFDYLENVLNLEPIQRRQKALLLYFVEKDITHQLDYWPLEMEGVFPAQAFGSGAAYFTFERAWPVLADTPEDRPISYQLYRFDLARAKADLAARGATPDGATPDGGR